MSNPLQCLGKSGSASAPEPLSTGVEQVVGSNQETFSPFSPLLRRRASAGGEARPRSFSPVTGAGEMDREIADFQVPCRVQAAGRGL